MQLAVNEALDDIDRTDLILIPGLLFSLKNVLPTFKYYSLFLNRQKEQGAVLASMCNSAFLLVENALLDDVQVTTHWAFANYFRHRFPKVLLDENKILCDSGNIITCGGTTAVMDLMLHLLRRYGSKELAQTCSRCLLIENIRPQ